MADSTARSKRQSLRFTVENHQLRFKTEYEDGTAFICNISAGGCALRDLSVTISLHEKILLILVLEEGGQIEIGAVVVRVVDNFAAVRFTQISDGNKQQVVKYFAKLLRSQRAG